MTHVVVLGAGFTRAFFPEAPLLVDKYPLTDLISRYAALTAGVQVLQTEVDSSTNGNVNLERVLTRLSSPMPYESGSPDAAQLAILLAEVERLFATKIQTATSKPSRASESLERFAQRCVDDRITCVTFNYDDVLDRALFAVNPVTRGQFSNVMGRRHWHPDGGYGFFCAPSESTVTGSIAYMDRDQTLLLKLHGSVNWRIRRGARRPAALADVVHHESWYPGSHGDVPGLDRDIERHLDDRPFLVPPVLAKTGLAEEPVLQHVWTAARDEISKADQVTFVGYSFPPTDLAARFLFTETIPRARRGAIQVVDFRPEDARAALMGSYDAVFGPMEASQFSWDGAVGWIARSWQGA